MSRNFIPTQSGTYNVYANELAQGTPSGGGGGGDAKENDENDKDYQHQQEPPTTESSGHHHLATTTTNTTSTTTNANRSGGGGGGLIPTAAAFAEFVRQQTLTTTKGSSSKHRHSSRSHRYEHQQQHITSAPMETIKCVVHFLDNTQHVFEVDRNAKGEELLELVFRHLELIEREYFALQFTEMLHHHAQSSTNSVPITSSQVYNNHNNDHHHQHHHHQSMQYQSTLSVGNGTTLTGTSVTSTSDTNSYEFLHGGGGSGGAKITTNTTTVYNKWLDPSKKICKQMRFTGAPFLLHFRVKFYVSEVGRLFEEYTRYHFYLQLRKNILADKLKGPESTMALLASYVLQSELGDFSEEDHKPGYSSAYQFIANQTPAFEAKVESLHRLHQGQTPADAEMNYLEEAKNLELYGVDLHQAKDSENKCIQIGVSANGLTIYKDTIKINTFSWAKIIKISFKRRFFFVQLKHEGTERYDNMVGFNLCSYRACKSLWKSCVEQHTFFRLHAPKPMTKKFFFFFSLGSKFRYSGKTEFQTIEENKRRLTRTERIFIRNNARNATMPSITTPEAAAGIGNYKYDASKHLANLRMANNEKQIHKNVISIPSVQSVADPVPVSVPSSLINGDGNGTNVVCRMSRSISSPPPLDSLQNVSHSVGVSSLLTKVYKNGTISDCYSSSSTSGNSDSSNSNNNSRTGSVNLFDRQQSLNSSSSDNTNTNNGVVTVIQTIRPPPPSLQQQQQTHADISTTIAATTVTALSSRSLQSSMAKVDFSDDKIESSLSSSSMIKVSKRRYKSSSVLTAIKRASTKALHHIPSSSSSKATKSDLNDFSISPGGGDITATASPAPSATSSNVSQNKPFYIKLSNTISKRIRGFSISGGSSGAGGDYHTSNGDISDSTAAAAEASIRISNSASSDNVLSVSRQQGNNNNNNNNNHRLNVGTTSTTIDDHDHDHGDNSIDRNSDSHSGDDNHQQQQQHWRKSMLQSSPSLSHLKSKVCSLPSSFVTACTVTTIASSTKTTTAFTPLTMKSLPYIDQDQQYQHQQQQTYLGDSVSTDDFVIKSDRRKVIKCEFDEKMDNNQQIHNGFTTTTTTTATTTTIDPHDIHATLIDDSGCGGNNSQQQYKQEIKEEIDSPIRELIKELYDVAATESASSALSSSVNVDEESPSTTSPVYLLTVTMRPDEDGRFGFNVKGGHDQNCPVLVSKVAPNTPADNSYPTKLHEGDQVIAINGTEVSGLKHEEVVRLIKSTKDQGPDPLLVLSIRPNVYHAHHCQDDNIEEPPFQYTLSFCKIGSTSTSAAPSQDRSPATPQKRVDKVADDKSNVLTKAMVKKRPSSMPMVTLLDISMNLLKEGLDSESLIAQFEQLYRRNEKEPITIARYMDNIPKNRYLDIAPYDSTRVILHECITGDYINASNVTMAIETSNTVNRYIATQGPLKRTTSDFWQMCWEQRSTVVVMVTPLEEDGRKKCFKYWPEMGQIALINERIELSLEECYDEVAFLERKFKMFDTKTKEIHYVTHLQYLAWPDQGVPDDDADFLKLIFRVRLLRRSAPDAPVVVHCSAGIGRTGVLILMETGICLIEANQPIYPLDLVRHMRNQRAMLIQTTMQFRFVCEALFHVYKDRVVTPLPQYCVSGLMPETTNNNTSSTSHPLAANPTTTTTTALKQQQSQSCISTSSSEEEEEEEEEQVEENDDDDCEEDDDDDIDDIDGEDEDNDHHHSSSNNNDDEQDQTHPEKCSLIQNS